MTDPTIENVFSLLDDWRHLPCYQLERRADIFFGLYLPDVLTKYLVEEKVLQEDEKISSCLIPEFPLKNKNNLSSRKVDFFALSTGGQDTHKQAFLVELKTEAKSLSEAKEQADYLECARNKGMATLLDEIVDIFKGNQTKASRNKYFHLVKKLAQLGLIKLPGEPEKTRLEEIIYAPNSVGFGVLKELVEIEKNLPRKLKVIYILPDLKKDDALQDYLTSKQFHLISFEPFKKVAGVHAGIGQRFAESLDRWIEPPSCKPPISRSRLQSCGGL